MKKLIAGILAAGVTVASLIAPVATTAGQVYAEEAEGGSRNALQVTPSGARLTFSKGEVLEGHAEHCPRGDDGCSITVTNIGTGPIRFRVYVSPYVVSGEENELSFTEESSTSYTQLSKWIKIQNEEGEFVDEAIFSAEPNEGKTVQYRITTPEDMPGGSQYAVIWAQIINDGESNGIETVGQIGAVLTGRSTEDIVETAEISDYDFMKFTFGGPLTAKATVKNTGNVDFAARYYYTAKTIFGKELYSNGTEDFVAAYPGTTYHIDFEWEDPPFLGIFQVEWKVVAADQEETHSAIVIIMPIIVMIVMVLLLTVIIIWIIIINRKRKERKARKLV